MAKRNKRRREKTGSPRRVSDSNSITDVSPDDDALVGNDGVELWSKTKRRIVSALILAYLFVLLVGPLANPVASPYLSGPIAEKVAPIHRVMFLGHGYRFFGPDPAPSHRLVYKGTRIDGTEFDGVFPSSEDHWPRLLYHRWFMLSETVFSENAMLPSRSQFDARTQQYEAQIEACRQAGNLKLSQELQLEQKIENEQYNKSRQRVEVLGRAIAEVLSKRNEAKTIELFIQIRQIPLAEEVAGGMQLEDESLLSQLIPIGTMRDDDFQIVSPSENPTDENQAVVPKLEGEFSPSWEVAQ